MCRHKVFIFIILILLSNFANGYVDTDKLIDPYDMSSIHDTEYYDPHELDSMLDTEYQDPHEFEGTSLTLKKQFSYNSCDEIEPQALAYLKRTINLILNYVQTEEVDANVFKGHVVIEMDMAKYEKLIAFTSGTFHDLKTVDRIMSEVLEKPSEVYLKVHLMSWFRRFFELIGTRNGVVLIVLLTYVYVVYKLLQQRFGLYYIFGFLFLNCIFIDIYFTWMKLHHKFDIDRMANTVKYQNTPTFCDPQQMSTFQYIWNAISTEDRCKKYHHEMLTDNFWMISPGVIIMEMSSVTISHICVSFTGTICDMIGKILSSLPYGLNLVLIPVVLVFFLLIVCILLSFITSVPIKFNFFHLITFSFGDRGNSQSGNTLSGKNVEKLLDIVKDQTTHREFIQEVKPHEISGIGNEEGICQLRNVPTRKLSEGIRSKIDDRESEGNGDGGIKTILNEEEKCDLDKGQICERKRKRGDGAGDM